jgi:hypothetical protein
MQSAGASRRWVAVVAGLAVIGSIVIGPGSARGQDEEDETDSPFSLRDVTLVDPINGVSIIFRDVQVLTIPNVRPARILAQFDIDNDGLPDGAADSDGDGLPDNWELGPLNPLNGDPLEPLGNGATERVDRVVSFPAPTAIGPGTPPTFLLARLPVATSALDADTDDDGISDFIEVFGLKFIDDNGNQILDPPGFVFEGVDLSEWSDGNNDGLPSVGEFPLENIAEALNRQNDFDGFFFTDPVLADTDGDGILDGDDLDPLINPETFGITIAEGIASFDRPGAAEIDEDLDNDGLGNGSDFANDLIDTVDFPLDLNRLIGLFRPDIEERGELPESLIEDLLGADWDGNGLFRITDVKNFSASVTRVELITRFGSLFFLGDPADPDAHCFCTEQGAVFQAEVNLPFGERGIGMGFQELLVPAARSEPFFPDVRIWAVLYAWRLPSFDIDGDGYSGAPRVLEDTHPFIQGAGGGTGNEDLDGQVDVVNFFPFCGNTGFALGLTLSLLVLARLITGRRRRF